MKTVAELKKDLDDAEEALSLAFTERNMRKEIYAEALSGNIKIGSIIEYDYGRDSFRTARVIHVGLFCDEPTYKAVCIRNDGSDGKHVNVRQWDNPRLKAAK